MRAASARTARSPLEMEISVLVSAASFSSSSSATSRRACRSANSRSSSMNTASASTMIKTVSHISISGIAPYFRSLRRKTTIPQQVDSSRIALLYSASRAGCSVSMFAT